MRIALIGYGKMGHEIERIALSRGHDVVCRIDIDNMQDFDSPSFLSADVAIEFTAPTQAYGNILKCFSKGMKVVSGSTGWMEQHSQEMKDLCRGGENTLFWSSNFSIGVALFSRVSEYLARLMNGYPIYDVSMEEVHHIHKLDAPSGTAITLAQGIVENLDRKTGWSKGTLIGADGTVTGSRDNAPQDIRIDSVRKGEIAGIHVIEYDSSSDFIKIIHSAKDRSGLALGAVLAAEYTISHTGFLGMSDLLGI